MLEFSHPDVKAKYTSTFKGDPLIHYPGGSHKNGFKTKLSNITIEQADRLFEMKNQNTLQLKPAAPVVKIIPEKPKYIPKEETLS
jgi:hypothetical protein